MDVLGEDASRLVWWSGRLEMTEEGILATHNSGLRWSFKNYFPHSTLLDIKER